jgi:hypothetical protein
MEKPLPVNDERLLRDNEPLSEGIGRRSLNTKPMEANRMTTRSNMKRLSRDAKTLLRDTETGSSASVEVTSCHALRARVGQAPTALR